jgi:hypothetical protein
VALETLPPIVSIFHNVLRVNIMCLRIVNTKQPAKPTYVYKVVTLTQDDNTKEWYFVTPYQYVRVDSGWFKADGQLPPLYKRGSIHDGAIHAYRSLRSAKSHHTIGGKWGGDRFVLKCRVYPGDFVANGKTGEVCYTRIFLTHDEYLKVLGQAVLERTEYLASIGRVAVVE